MLLRRFALSAIALALLAVFVTEAAAQRGRQAPRGEEGSPPPIVDASALIEYTCPNCNKEIASSDGQPPTSCPHCNVKITAESDGNGGYNLTAIEVSDNKWKKPLMYGGGALLVLGLIGMVLKYTVFAAPPPKKKKKKRRDDDDADEHPRKKKRPVVEMDDEDDDRPRRRKPRVVEDDE